MKSNCQELEGFLPRRNPVVQTAFGCPRNFLDNRYVYVVISSRFNGLGVGINVSPEGVCNFNCIYCEVNRPAPSEENRMDLDVMTSELQKTLALIRSGKIRKISGFEDLAADLLSVDQVILSGDGEPTLAPTFPDALRRIIHVRASSVAAFFKLVLFTNGSGLNLPEVQNSLKFLTSEDEIWIKLDAGSQEHMTRINGPHASLARIKSNILLVGKQRPIGIQSLFPMIDGKEPSQNELDAYIDCLKDLRNAGARIEMVQVFSGARPALDTGCEHLPLKSLCRIRQRVIAETGLRAEVF